jgi:hypothetical protein
MTSRLNWTYVPVRGFLEEINDQLFEKSPLLWNPTLVTTMTTNIKSSVLLRTTSYFAKISFVSSVFSSAKWGIFKLRLMDRMCFALETAVVFIKTGLCHVFLKQFHSSFVFMSVLELYNPTSATLHHRLETPHSNCISEMLNKIY